MYALSLDVISTSIISAYFAHELRNPLSAIDCALSVLKEKEASRSNQDDNDDPETGDIVTGMQLCTSFMSSIINNLLDSRKLEEGKMVLKKNPLSLEGLVKDVRQMMAPAVQPGVELLILTSCHNDGGRGDWVFGDVHRLQQVLTNVTSNSIKFTRSGSITWS
jgi:two-component system, NarL family, sensor histidine kinase BarA